MRIPKIRDNNQWIIPRTYVRIGGVWNLVNNYIRDAGNWGDEVVLNEVVIYITSTTTNLNVQTLFEATYPGSWASTAPKRLVINSGVIVGATNTSNYALNIPSGFGSTVRIDNSGSIQGAGGAENGGTGGNAIFAGQFAISINNQGTIYAGGGGGGQGGTGGGGSYRTGIRLIQIINTDGGAGGAGGVGQGYNQSNTGGSAGAAGGTNAGTGGTGGTGGTWGASGADGSVGADGNRTTAPLLDTIGGPTYGGNAGYYITNNNNVIWINTGTVAGRVG
jgi:hypothetical protein